MDKKKHAEHNENACKLLFNDGNYCDWVVTTAFYSALHYVQYEIFPKTIEGKFYGSFNRYYTEHYAGVTNKPNRHVSTINLVKKQIGDQAHEIYSWLYGLCMNARYKSYQVNPLIAEECLKRLERLKSFMTK